MAVSRAVISWLFLAVWCSSCTTVPAGCDPAAARQVVYSEEGFPAYEGQALLFSSCGYGTYCHNTTTQGNLRRGVPRGLDFDLDPASYDARVGDVDRLEHVQQIVFSNRHAIWEQVVSGAMPPGREGLAILESDDRPRYARQAGSERVALPELATAEGLEIFRNWLACGVPVIERTEEREDGLPSTIGGVVRPGCDEDLDCNFSNAARCDLEMNVCDGCESDMDCEHLEEPLPLCSVGRCTVPVEPTWASIHSVILETTCALALCHGNPDGDHEAALDLRGREAAFDRVMLASVTESCGETGLRLIEPGEPDQSLLYLKVSAVDDAAVCGGRMPDEADMPLPVQWVETIRQWISDGAPGP